jgi:PAS domain S-box-containing protein
MHQFRSILRAFIVALLATVLMAVVRRFVFIPILRFNPPYMSCLLAVTLAAWVGGLKSGLFASLLNGGLLWTFFRGNNGTQLFSMSEQFRLVLFLVNAGLVSWGIDALHAARRRLEQALRELRRREETLRMAADSGNVGIWEFNPLTGEHNWSSRTKAMFGLPFDADVTTEFFLDRVHPEDRERVNQSMQAGSDPSRDGKYEAECRIIWPDGTVHWILARGQAMFEGEGSNRRRTRGIGTVLDITERKKAEEIIRASESRLKAIMDNTSAVIVLKDVQSRYLMINRRYEQLYNLTQHQIIGKTTAEIHPSDIAARLMANDRQVIDTRQPLEFEEVVLHGDGPHTYVSVKFPIFDSAGNVIAVGGISTDISDRKRAADALAEEREMLQHTIEVQDHERQLIAYEIHDGLVQYATGALMQLESIRDQVKSEVLAEQIENTLGVMRKTVEEGRRIINGIHTTILDDCGVVAAVQQLLEDEERAHVQLEFIKDESLGRMAPNTELALYHITREALTNAHKHSHSDKVRVELGRSGDRVHLEVRDWGVGYLPPAVAKGVHGLRGMIERARIAGGQCTVQNAPGKGTQVIVDLPYRRRTNDAPKPSEI